MGNRTFLSVTNADTDSVDYENTAFETNNFLAPVWFCLVSQEQFQCYSDQLMQAWSKIQPHMDQPDSMGGCCTAIALEFTWYLGTFPFACHSCIWVAGNLIDPCTAVFCCRDSSGAFAIFLVHGWSCHLSERHSKIRYPLAGAAPLAGEGLAGSSW